jgi:hypothetical protein
METEIEYERPPEEDEEDKPRRQRKVKKVARTKVRVPWCMTPIWVTDDELPDDKIEEFVAQGKCKWLEDNDPELAQEIRERYYKRVNELDKRPNKKRFKR